MAGFSTVGFLWGFWVGFFVPALVVMQYPFRWWKLCPWVQRLVSAFGRYKSQLKEWSTNQSFRGWDFVRILKMTKKKKTFTLYSHGNTFFYNSIILISSSFSSHSSIVLEFHTLIFKLVFKRMSVNTTCSFFFSTMFPVPKNLVVCDSRQKFSKLTTRLLWTWACD